MGICCIITQMHCHHHHHHHRHYVGLFFFFSERAEKSDRHKSSAFRFSSVEALDAQWNLLLLNAMNNSKSSAIMRASTTNQLRVWLHSPEQTLCVSLEPRDKLAISINRENRNTKKKKKIKKVIYINKILVLWMCRLIYSYIDCCYTGRLSQLTKVLVSIYFCAGTIWLMGWLERTFALKSNCGHLSAPSQTQMPGFVFMLFANRGNLAERTPTCSVGDTFFCTLTLAKITQS